MAVKEDVELDTRVTGARTAARELGLVRRELERTRGGVRSIGSDARLVARDMDLLGRSGRAMGRAVKAGALAGTAGFAGMAYWVGRGGQSLMRIEQIGFQTENRLRSTGGIANVTRKAIDNLAGSIEAKTGVEAEAVTEAQNMLLTFTKVRNEQGKNNKIFNQATHTLTDMAIGMGKGEGGLQAASIQLGKALNDPVKGVSALAKVGVQFDATQKKRIEAFVEENDILSAQKMILGELNTQFGGSARAFGESDAGKIARFNHEVGTLQETIAGSAAPAMEDFTNFMVEDGIPKLQEWGRAFERDGVPKVRDFGRWLRDDAGPAARDFAEDMKPLINSVIPALGTGLGVVRDVSGAIAPNVTAIVDAFNEMPEWMRVSIAGGGLLAAGGFKVNRMANRLRGGAGAGSGGLGGGMGPVPVYIVNGPGARGPGGAAPGGALVGVPAQDKNGRYLSPRERAAIAARQERRSRLRSTGRNAIAPALLASLLGASLADDGDATDVSSGAIDGALTAGLGGALFGPQAAAGAALFGGSLGAVGAMKRQQEQREIELRRQYQESLILSARSGTIGREPVSVQTFNPLTGMPSFTMNPQGAAPRAPLSPRQFDRAAEAGVPREALIKVQSPGLVKTREGVRELLDDVKGLSKKEYKLLFDLMGLDKADRRLTNTQRKVDGLARDREATITITEQVRRARGWWGGGGDDPEPRAGGGPVRRGRPYIVGENRPELFVPDQDGTILPSVPGAASRTAVLDAPEGPVIEEHHHHVYIDGREVQHSVERRARAKAARR